MKKALKTDLTSLAHKILQLKDTTPYSVLAAQAQELYEKLAVLAYAEKLNMDPKPTIGLQQLETQLEALKDQEVLPVEAVASDSDAQTIPDAHSNEEPLPDLHRPDGTAYNMDET